VSFENNDWSKLKENNDWSKLKENNDWSKLKEKDKFLTLSLSPGESYPVYSSKVRG
jgi:hypothetical protein